MLMIAVSPAIHHHGHGRHLASAAPAIRRCVPRPSVTDDGFDVSSSHKRRRVNPADLAVNDDDSEPANEAPAALALMKAAVVQPRYHAAISPRQLLETVVISVLEHTRFLTAPRTSPMSRSPSPDAPSQLQPQPTNLTTPPPCASSVHPTIILASRDLGSSHMSPLRILRRIAWYAARFPNLYSTDTTPAPADYDAMTLTTCEPQLLICALALLIRISTRHSHSPMPLPEPIRSPQTLLLACLMLAEAHVSDIATSCKTWANMCGISACDVAALKRVSLNALGNATIVGADEYQSLCEEVTNRAFELYGPP